ncbi:MAG: FAD-dependent oxidoreductase, partial [Ignavibacteria bacterium]|nr:FAD-dependent oxidoreductase [Ignavibacteria bacterium]
GIKKIESGYKVLTNKGEFTSKVVINCSGLMGVEVAKYHNPNTQHRIEFRKGEYQVSDVRDANYLNHIIYPTPSKLGKGVLALKTVEGNLMFGPTSRVIEDGYDFSTTQSGLAEVDEKIKNIIKPLPKSRMIRQFAGVRPTSLSKDFIIEDLDGFVNVIVIDSPGLASSPGISEYVIENLLSKQLELKLKEKLIDFKWKKHLSLDERKELIKQDARFGKIVCVCETISEKEILDAIHLPVGAHSVKGVKRLVRPGSGRCQGGFCESEVVRLLAQELNIDMDKVPFDNDCFLYPLGDHI